MKLTWIIALTMLAIFLWLRRVTTFQEFEISEKEFNYLLWEGYIVRFNLRGDKLFLYWGNYESVPETVKVIKSRRKRKEN